MDEFHEVVEVAAGARDDPGRIDELRMEMILEEGQHDEPQEARDADDEDGQAASALMALAKLAKRRCRCLSSTPRTLRG